MSSTNPDAAWTASLTDVVLRSRFGAATLERGLAYAAEGRVGRLETGDHGRLVTAQVHGGGALPYQVLVLSDGSGARGLSSRCTCPMRADCKHVVAVISAVRGTIRPQGPAWHQALDTALQAERQSRRGTRTATALALQFVFGAARGQTRWGADPPSSLPRLRLRPLLESTTGRWVKRGASWDDLMRTDAARPVRTEQRDVLRRIHGLRLTNRYAYLESPEHLDVADLGAHVWALLDQAREVGVAFVAADTDAPAPRLTDAAASFSVQVAPGDQGGLDLRPRVHLEGRDVAASDVTLLGSPAHGLLHREGPAGALVFGPLDRVLRPAEQALAASPDPVHVPEADVPQFTASYYPALQRVIDLSPDAALDLPAVHPPVLELEAAFGEGLEVLLTWRFGYAVGSQVRHVDVVPPSQDAAALPGAPAEARDLPAEQAIIDSLPRPETPHGLTTLIGRRRALVPSQRYRDLDAVSVATTLLPELSRRDDVRVTVVGDMPQFRAAEGDPVVRVRAHEVDPEDAHDRTDWFDLGLSVSIDGEGVPFVNLFTALVKGESHLVLDSGTYFPLDTPELDGLRDLIEESRHLFDPVSATLRVTPEHAGLWDELVAIGVVAEQSQEWVRAVGALLDQGELPALDPPADLRAELRPYQLEGFRWLAYLIDARLGGILADDMGLGKTLQTLAMAARAAELGRLDGAPLLVVAPTSVVSTWAAEAARFTPSLRVRTLTETSRRRRTPLAEAVGDAHIVITSYAILRLDAADVTAREWGGLVLDEAQFVKNHRSKTYQAVRKVRAPGRLVLTGTPLENSLMDLWSLLSIAAPGLFPDPEMFADVYRRPIEEGTDPAKLPRLLRHIRPLVLRRTKEAVASELPPKQEQIVTVTLSPAHRRRYDTHLHRERQKVLKLLADDELGRNRVTIFRSLTLLRLMSLAPSLVDADDTTPGTKLDVLMELLDDVVAGGHRALVFSQFTGFLGLVRQRLGAAGIGHVYLDGRTRNRGRRIEEFKNGTDPVFCISLKAGGFGLTLTEADYVFVLDPWWNPAAEAQAIDRTHRIGQDKHVMVYRLVAADTIEEKVVALQQRKRDLFDQVVGDGADVAAPLSAADIRALLTE